MTRLCSSSSRCKSFCTSPSSSFDTGMPVQRLTTSAMSSSSTSSLISRCVSACRGERRLPRPCSLLSSSGSLPYFSSAALLQVVLPLGLLDLDAWSARSARAASRSCCTACFSSCHWALQRVGVRPSGRPAPSPACSSRSLRRGVLLLLQGLALDLQLHDAAVDLVQLRRASSRSRCAAWPPPRPPGRWPCRAGSGR